MTVQLTWMDTGVVVAHGDEATDRIPECVSCPGHVEAAVERRGHRDAGSTGEIQVPRLDVGVDQVELVLLGEDQLHGVAELFGWIVGEAQRAKGPRNRGDMPAGYLRIAAREGRDLVTATIELDDQLRDDSLGAPITDRRNGL